MLLYVHLLCTLRSTSDTLSGYSLQRTVSTDILTNAFVAFAKSSVEPQKPKVLTPETGLGETMTSKVHVFLSELNAAE